MRIFTITLNPAFDLHYELTQFSPGKENDVRRVLREAGGKGINTSRALTRNGIPNTAVVILGRDNAPQFEAQLASDGLKCQPVYVPGMIRENITLHPDGQPETRISLADFALSADALHEVQRKLDDQVRAGDWISFAGRIPCGVSPDEICGILAQWSRGGIQLAVDCNSLTAKQLRTIHPTLIKPNEPELQKLSGTDHEPDMPEIQLCAARLVQQGTAEQILVSLGSRGALYCSVAGQLRISVPPLSHPVSTIGAGDSTVAGFLAAAFRGEALRERLRTAAAWGTAACMTEGTRPPEAMQIGLLRSQVEIYPV